MQSFQEIAQQLKTLGNPKRLHILWYLRKNFNATVSELAEAIGLSVVATSKHLQILLLSGLVKNKKRGLFVTYRMSLGQNNLTREVMKMMH